MSSFARNLKAAEADWAAEIRKQETREARRRDLNNRMRRKPGHRDPNLRSRPRTETDPAPVPAVNALMDIVRRAAEKERNFTIMKGDLLKDHYLTADHLTKSYGAVAFLNCMGKLFNVLYTCTFESMYVRNCSDAKVDADVKRHVRHLYKWFKYRDEKMYMQWFVERGEDRGLHFHALLHVPEELIPGLKHEVEQSIWTIYGRRARRPAKRGKAGKAADPTANPFAAVDDTKTVDFKINTTVDDQWRRWRYCFKGIDKHLTMSFQDHPSWKPTPIREYLGLKKMSHQGRYTKQRFGWSSTLLGPKARRAFERKYGKMPNRLMRAKEPGDLYGSQYLDWSRMNMCEVALLASFEI